MPSTVEIPEGYEVVPGRSQSRAVALLKAAERAGVDPTLVRSYPLRNEYHVPSAVAAAYREADAEKPVSELTKNDVPGPTAWAPNVVHPESATLAAGSTPSNEGKAAEGGTLSEPSKPSTTTTTSGGDGTAEGAEDKPTEETQKVADEAAEKAQAGADENGVPLAGQTVEEPKRNASHEAWIAFAETKGYDKSEDLTRNDLIEKFGTGE